VIFTSRIVLHCNLQLTNSDFLEYIVCYIRLISGISTEQIFYYYFLAGLGGAQYQIPMAMPGAVPRLQYPGLIGQQQAAALQG